MKLFAEGDGEGGGDSEDEVTTRKKRKLQVIEDDILPDTVVPAVVEDFHKWGDEVNKHFSEFNADIFDAENSDDEVSPVKDDENATELTCNENVNEENSLSPKHKRKKYKQNEKDCGREGRRFKKEKDQELFNIFSENQRLLRESSVNLPYHQPPKRTLKEFLNERRKSVVSLELKGHQKDLPFISCQGMSKQTVSRKAEENSEMRCVRVSENLPEGTNNTGDEVSQTVLHVNISCEQLVGQQSKGGCSISSSNDIVNPNIESNDSHSNQDSCDRTNRNDVTQKISSETITTNKNIENISDLVSGSVLSSGVEECKLLPSGIVCVPNEHVDFQSHIMHEKDILLQKSGSVHKSVLKGSINDIPEENAVSHFMSDADLKQDHDAENNSHIKNDMIADPNNDSLGKSDMEQTTRGVLPCSGIEKDNSAFDLSFSNKIIPDKVEVPSISFKPRITGAPNTVINLDDSDDENSSSKAERKSDLELFMEKFVNHTKRMHRKHHAQDVNLNIVSKDPEKEGVLCRTTLKVSVNSPQKESSALKAPGAKLLALKEQLFSEITKKREAAVRKWQELDSLDNEEELPEDEEEAEVSEESEADVEDNDDESEIEESADDESCGSEKEKNPFLDDEASESDDDINIPHLNFSTKQDFGNKEKVVEGSAAKESYVTNSKINEDFTTKHYLSDTKINEDVQSKEELVVNSISKEYADAGEDSLRLFLESDSDQNDEVTEVHVGEKSFDLTGSTIPPYQPYGGFGPDKVSYTQSELRSTGATHNTQSSEMSLSRTPASQLDGSQQLFPTQDLQKSFQLFRNKQDSACAGLLHLTTGKGSQAIPDDILDVCSGNFTGSLVLPCTGSPSPVKESEILSDSSQTDACNKDELLALCSGKFTGSSVSGSIEPLSVVEEDLEDALSESSLTETARVKLPPKVLSISDDEEDDQKEISGDDDNESEGNSIVTRTGRIADEDPGSLSDEESFVDDKAKKVTDFLEDEAELSGSDVGSEENEEDYDDHYEEDVPDEELPSDEELRDQIGKVHFKNIMDEDKRELRLYQELFFEDGDLHSDGPGRQRKFTWRNTDSTFSGGGDQNSESENDDVQDDEKWRIERHEREKWLQEQEEKNLHSETSPVKVARRQSSVKIEIVNRVKESPVIMEDRKIDNRPLLFKKDECTLNHHGSFLGRRQDFLTVLAKKLKKSDDDATGSRTTKHFIFRAVSPQKGQPKMETKGKLTRTPVSTFNKNNEKKAVSSSLNKSVFDFFST